jgi:hypothetical protein
MEIASVGKRKDSTMKHAVSVKAKDLKVGDSIYQHSLNGTPFIVDEIDEERGLIALKFVLGFSDFYPYNFKIAGDVRIAQLEKISDKLKELKELVDTMAKDNSA